MANLRLMHYVCILIGNSILVNSEVPIINIECASEHDLDFELFPGCQFEDSCIISGIEHNDENSLSYEVNRTQIHEFKCLIFVDSHLQKIPSNIFIAARSKITHLYANNVSINELSRNSFLIANQLESVDLSWNSLEKLHETAFYDASNLSILNLSHNFISELSPNVFEKLDKLSILDLSYNQISSVPFELFQPLKSLETLNLRQNRLQLRYGIFPENLHTLDLSHNNLEFLEKFRIFSLLKNLETLLLHGNRLEGIHQNFIEKSRVKFVGISENIFSCNILSTIVLKMRAHNKTLIVENDVRFTSNIDGVRCTE